MSKGKPAADTHEATLERLDEMAITKIVRELKAAGPMSVYALAKQVGRNYSNVHGDIQRLLALDLVAKNSDGQVLVPFDDIVVQVDASLMAAA